VTPRAVPVSRERTGYEWECRNLANPPGAWSSKLSRIHQQGQALVRAIEALESVQKTGPLERAVTWYLLELYRHRLHEAIKTAHPGWCRRC
jgi:pyridoxine/pyridoxamine 5'-phosphate oxidase